MAANDETEFGILHWAIVFAGFQQSTGRPSGSFKLWQRVHAAAGGKMFRSEFRAWNDDVDELANLIFHASGDHLAPTINVAGYSWGGMTAANFCRRLAERGIEVDRVVLCDPVYRHRYWFGNWRALVPGSTIRIPPNVRRVDVFRQSVNLPAGHNVVADCPNTYVAEAIELNRRHEWMDDAAIFHETFVGAVRGGIWSTGNNWSGSSSKPGDSRGWFCISFIEHRNAKIDSPPESRRSRSTTKRGWNRSPWNRTRSPGTQPRRFKTTIAF